MAASSAVALLCVASLTVLVSLQQESKYMMTMTSVAASASHSYPTHQDATTASTTSTTPSSSAAVASHLSQQGTQSNLCAAPSTADPNNHHNHNNNNTVQPLLPPWPTQHALPDFLEGPALRQRQEREQEQEEEPPPLVVLASCKFQPNAHTNYFPHALQQLIRCVSWWNLHKQEHQLASSASVSSSSVSSRPESLPQGDPQRMDPSLELILVWNKDTAQKPSPFLMGFINALRKVWKLRVYPLRGKVPVVRAKVDYYTKEESDQKKKNNDDDSITTSPTTHHRGFQAQRVSDLQGLRRDVIQEFFPLRYQQEQQSTAAPAQQPGILSFTTASTATGPVRRAKITILNRHVDSGRSILNAQELLQTLQRQDFVRNNHVTVELVDSMDGRSFLDQVYIFSHSDLVISPHGAQLSSLFFMPPCGAVLELFGRGYEDAEFYGSLAAMSGIRYSHLYTGAGSPVTVLAATNATTTTTTLGTATAAVTTTTKEAELAMWNKDEESRAVARRFPICAPIATIVEYVRTELEDWNRRIQNPQTQCL